MWKFFKNCLTFAKKKQRESGGYICSRPTRRPGIWRAVRGKHYLWLPPVCPHHNKPCPYMESYSPEEDLALWKLPISFKGKVKFGDVEDRVRFVICE